MQVPHWGQKLRVKFMQPISLSPTKAKKTIVATSHKFRENTQAHS